MKRPLFLLLPVLLLAGILAGLFFLQSQGSNDEDNLEANPQAEAPETPDGPAELVRDGDQPLGGPREGLGTATSEENGAQAEGEPDPETEWLQGRVVWPTDYQPEGDIWVFAMPRSTERRSLDEALTWNDDQDSQEWFQSSALTHRTLSLRRDRRPLARVRANADGTFRLPLPAWRPGMHLQVLGQHLYREESLAVPRPPWDQPVELETEVGAWIQATLVQPEGADLPSEGAQALVKIHYPIDVEGALNPRIASPTGQYFTQAGPDGSFAFQGIPPQEDLRLSIEPKAYARMLHSVGSLVAGQTVTMEVPLDPGRSVLGRVVNPDQEPVEGAMVLVHAEVGALSRTVRELRKTTTDAEGRFHLAAIPSGALLVQAHHDAYLASQPARVSEAEATEEVLLQLQAGATLEGLAQTSAGEPVPNAWIEAVLDVGNLQPMEGLGVTQYITSAPATRADEQGRFALTGLAPMPYRLQAQGEVDGIPHVGSLNQLRPDAKGVVVTLSPRITLAGRAVDEDGDPLTPYNLSIRRVLSGEMVSRYDHEKVLRIRDETGAFAIPDLLPGQWELQVHSETHWLTPPVVLDLPQPEDAPELVLSCQPAQIVRGRVVNLAGQPVAGARIRTYTTEIDLSQFEDPGPLIQAIYSDEAGEFLFGPLEAGSHSVRAEADDYCDSEPVGFEVEPGGAVPSVTLTLTEGGHLTGVVLQDNGEPNPGRVVNAVSSKNMADAESTTSDANGAFEFRNLSPGSYQVVALNRSTTEMVRAMEEGSASIAEITGNMKMGTAQIEEGKTTHILLGEPPSDPILISGQVTLGTDPLAEAFISFHADGKSLMDDMVLETLDAEGRYEAQLDGAGRYRITVQQLTGGAMQQITVEFVRDIPSQERVRMDFALPEGRISGSVRTPSGKPAGGERVTVLREGRASTATMLGGSFVETLTDGEGMFDIRGLQPGTYVVAAGGSLPLSMIAGPSQEEPYGRTTSRPVKLQEGEWVKDLRIRLQEPGRLVAKVVGTDGSPVQGASLFLRDSTGRPLEAFSLVTTNAQGECNYRGLAPGSYTVLARIRDLASQEVGPIEVKAGEASEVEISLEAGTILHLTFRTKEGEPCPAELEVFGPQGQEVSRLFGMQEFQALYLSEAYRESERRLGPLPPGRYKIVANIEGTPVEKSIRLHGGDVKRVRLRAR